MSLFFFNLLMDPSWRNRGCPVDVENVNSVADGSVDLESGEMNSERPSICVVDQFKVNFTQRDWYETFIRRPELLTLNE